jgi:RNA polymerase sigma factor (TIGR02999 family)
MSEVTQILELIREGDRAAANKLLPLVYEELRRLAVQPGLTLQPTALVHEAYIRLVGDEAVKWDGRSHFFGAAAEAMRRILIESARRRNSLKQGGNVNQRELTDGDAYVFSDNTDELLDLDAALGKLAAHEPELAKLVELRYFAGLTVDEAAQAMGTSVRTAKRNWAYARAWLGRELDHHSSAMKSDPNSK